MEATDQLLRTQGAPTRGAQTPAAADTTKGPTERLPPLLSPRWGQESLDYTRPEEDAQRPSAGAERAVTLDLDLWLPWTSDMVKLTL